jgi:hypothetical protein
MEKTCQTSSVGNEVLHRVKEERNILYITKRSKASSTDHCFLRSCLLKHVIEGQIRQTEVTGKKKKRRKLIPDGV